MNFNESPEFQKDVKALGKKVRTLQLDIERVRARIEPLYIPVKDVDIQTYRSLFFSGSVATILHKTDTHEIIKMRLDTDTRTMQSKLRLVFVAVVSSETVTFIELYAKNDKNREDQRRLQQYLG